MTGVAFIPGLGDGIKSIWRSLRGGADEAKDLAKWATPRQACLDCVAAAARAARAQGHRADAVADMLGYSDARALRRALQAGPARRGS